MQPATLHYWKQASLHVYALVGGAGFQKLAEILHLRTHPSKVQQLLAYVPEPIRHKGRDISARLDYELQDFAPWQLVFATALLVLLALQLLKWASTASEDVRERGETMSLTSHILQCRLAGYAVSPWHSVSSLLHSG